MWSILAFTLLVLLNPQMRTGESSQPHTQEISPEAVSAVVQAIQDEIYAGSYEKEFWGFQTAGSRGPVAQFTIYINPELRSSVGGMGGTVIYKYLPFGEVVRQFMIGPDGTAYLSGSPDNEFSWNQPNTKTIYMNDDEVCQKKRDWKRVPLEIDLTPDAARVKAAVVRQKMRVGPSQPESSRKHHRMKSAR